MLFLVGTFGVAMGVGFFMQQQDASAAYTDMGGAAPEMPADVTPEALQSPAAAIATNAVMPIPAPAMLAPPPAAAPIAPLDVQARSEQSCDISMSANVRSAALVMLELAAPCNGGESFTIHHEGMMFSAKLSGDGRAALMAPALSERATFIAALESGGGALAEADVPALADFDRVVLQWKGAPGFEIHAMEYGATYGEAGHVWHDAPRTAAETAAGNGGFLLALGDGRVPEPRFAQVYTFPRAAAVEPGKVALSVEAEVTAANCATQMEAQTLERADGATRITDLVLALPECEAIGDFLVLKNLLTDLTLQTG
ncbi:MAG: hypothetical protein AAF618_04415 [Pseudomonadota bacterium]